MPESSQGSSRFQGTLAPLGIPDFRNLLISNTLWWQGMWMEMIVVGWLVLELTDSAWQVALIGFHRSIPLLITGFISSPLANRLGRIRLILIAQGLSLFVIAGITLLLWADRLAFWHLAVGAALFGICWSLNWTARRALVPDLVGKSRTVEAMLLESFTQNISRVLGPFASGSLIAVLGARGCYVAITVISVTSLLIMLRVKGQGVPTPEKPTASPWTLMVEGLRYMRHNQPIIGDLIITVIMNFLAFPYMTLLPVFARDVLGQGPVGLGILGAGNGTGAFLGLYLINRLRHHLSRGWIFAIGSTLQAAALFGFSISTLFSLSLTLLILSGVGQACFSVMQSAIMLLAARDDMRDRAMGSLVLAIGSGPLGRLQIGALAEAFGAPFALGLQTAVAAGAVLIVTAALPGFRQRIKKK